MTRETLINTLQSIDSQIKIADGTQYTTVTVAPENLHHLAVQLKTSPSTHFDYLISLTGVDFSDKSLGVVYHLASTLHKEILVLKTAVPNRENPTLDTVSDIWKTAEFHEREVYDLLGITFNNHPDMRRIFLEEDWEGHPLRKDYKDEKNIVER